MERAYFFFHSTHFAGFTISSIASNLSYPTYMHVRAPVRASSTSYFISQLFSGPALGYGFLLGLVAMGSKLVTGQWTNRKDVWPVGWAMVGRGELGFVMVHYISVIPG